MPEGDRRDLIEALATMKHDLRTPLSVILGLAQVLESELTDETHKEDLGHIIDSGRKLAVLIDDFVHLVHESIEEQGPGR